jgi:SAM-dependent methyltransferase
MTTILIIILEWIAVLILFIVLILLFIWVISGIKAKVPFIPIPNSILPDIYKALELKEEGTLYDLGCGDARVLFYASKLNPKVQYIGIENSLFPTLLARIARWCHKKRTGIDVRILNEDFFTHDLSNATHIFTYLYPNVMDDMLSKLDKELKPGTRLVSISFRFTQKQPIAEFDLGRRKYQLAQKIYVYEF